MSKVHKALLHARAERLQRHIPASQSPPHTIPRISAIHSSETTTSHLEREMLILDQSISDLTDERKRTILQFMGLQGGEGTSTIIRAFANLQSGAKGKSTLIIDAYRHQPQLEQFAVRPRPPLEQSIQDDWGLNEAIQHIGTTQLFISKLYSTMGEGGAAPKLSSTQENIFEEVRHRFDVVLIDSPPVSSSVDGLSLCKQVTGVVLVIEAEKSRSAIIQHTKEQILQSGGNLLGIVFNKHKHHIPKWIYKKL